ncbi:hypothetical protein JHK86_004628 [Glycine max]|nr:hypothetical protein JHK86_004628 [Glycine max]
MDTFDGVDAEHTKDVILFIAGRLYQSYRCRLHQYFKKYETMELASENKPNDLSVQDWEYLINYFSTSKFKNQNCTIAKLGQIKSSGN